MKIKVYTLGEPATINVKDESRRNDGTGPCWMFSRTIDTEDMNKVIDILEQFTSNLRDHYVTMECWKKCPRCKQSVEKRTY